VSKGESSKYGKITSSEKEFEVGEPIFLIRATDPFAAHAIIEYARRCERQGADADHVNSAFDHAMAVAEWQRDNPEKVKPVPD
jgi:hypothetical protein